jgi:hypothetical protein
MTRGIRRLAALKGSSLCFQHQGEFSSARRTSWNDRQGMDIEFWRTKAAARRLESGDTVPILCCIRYCLRLKDDQHVPVDRAGCRVFLMKSRLMMLLRRGLHGRCEEEEGGESSRRI